jgi:hypothetical protein
MEMECLCVSGAMWTCNGVSDWDRMGLTEGKSCVVDDCGAEWAELERWAAERGAPRGIPRWMNASKEFSLWLQQHAGNGEASFGHCAGTEEEMVFLMEHSKGRTELNARGAYGVADMKGSAGRAGRVRDVRMWARRGKHGRVFQEDTVEG